MMFGVLILAFAVFASIALGAATAWGLYAYTRLRWIWLLTPAFAVLWLILGAGSFLAIAFEEPTPVAAPAPYVTPPPDAEQDRVIEVTAEEAP
jgi:hypothetical protein